jgi:signal transduction histidine kinase
MKLAAQRYTPTLRQILGIGSFILTILALCTTFALIYYPKVLRFEIDNTHQINENLHTSNLLTANLLRFSRTSLLFIFNRRHADLEAQARSETQIFNLIETLKRKTPTDEMRALINQVEANSSRFISSRKETESKNYAPSVNILQTQGEALELALDNIRAFIEVNLNLANQVSKKAERIDHLTDALGAILIVIFILGFGAVIFLSRNFLYRPLSQIKSTLIHFSQGDRSARAEIQGAIELRAIGSVYNKMAEDLENHERQRFEFLAGVVHDLRNPLSALKMASEVLARESGQWQDSKARNTVQLLDKQTGRLNRMISDLMDATRIQSGQLRFEFEDRDLRKIASECVDLWKNMSAKHEITLTLSKDPIIVHCDSGRIAQVLNNLLSNAIKYSPGGGPISVSATVDSIGRANLTVTDHGIGIPASEVKELFRPFFRSSIAHRGKIPGAGIGLSVSKKIIEAHGGTLSLESTEGLGSTFRIQLSTAAAEAA